MQKRVLVCDLDNTLYDWVHYFVSAFYAMVDSTVETTGCDRNKLLDDLKFVHQLYHDSEHPFALLETATIRELFPGSSRAERAKKLDNSFRAFNSVRKRTLKLYPEVRSTLDILSNKNILLIAHTESKLFGVVDRLTRLGISEYFYKIYCRERPADAHPSGGSWRYLEQFPMYRVVELSRHQRKPDQAVLLEICKNDNINPMECIYIGDSMARDVLMAKRAQIVAVWAKYGATHHHSDYQKLIRVSHWSADDIEREKRLAFEASLVAPDYIAERSFSEVLDLF